MIRVASARAIGAIGAIGASSSLGVSLSLGSLYWEEGTNQPPGQGRAQPEQSHSPTHMEVRHGDPSQGRAEASSGVDATSGPILCLGCDRPDTGRLVEREAWGRTGGGVGGAGEERRGKARESGLRGLAGRQPRMPAPQQ